MASVKLNAIEKSFGDGPKVLTGVNLEIKDGEFVVFVGPSGCGKSTLLRIIAGLEEATGGEIFIGDELANDIPPAKRGTAMVFQSYALYPHMTVAENMGFSLKLAGRPKEEIKSAVNKAAEILQISHLLDRTPRQLSGGQRQRVALARAVAIRPGILLLDEPLTALDAALRDRLRGELNRLLRALVGGGGQHRLTSQLPCMSQADMPNGRDKRRLQAFAQHDPFTCHRKGNARRDDKYRVACGCCRQKRCYCCELPTGRAEKLCCRCGQGSG